MEEQKDNNGQDQSLNSVSVADEGESVKADVADEVTTNNAASRQSSDVEAVDAKLPFWWRLDDKIPSDRKPTDAEKAQAGRLMGMQQGVFGKNAKLFNILTIAFLSVVIITVIIGLFAPVFGLYDTYDDGAFIADTRESNEIKGHYIKVNQSGIRIIIALGTIIERNDNRALRLKTEHENAVNAIKSEYAEWLNENSHIDADDMRKEYERIFTEHMSKTDFAAYVSSLMYSSEKKIDTYNMIATIVPIFLIAISLAVSSIAAVILVIIRATKTFTELTNKSDRIMFWHSLTVLQAYFVNIVMDGVFGARVHPAFIICPVAVHIGLAIAIGIVYTKTRGKLDVKLICLSAIAPICVIIGIGLMFGTDYVTVNADNVKYGAPLIKPLVEAICSSESFDYKPWLIGLLCLLAICFGIVIITQRIYKKRAALGVETPMLSVGGLYSQIVTVCFIFGIVIVIVCACLGSVEFSIRPTQYVAALLCAAPYLTEMIMKNIDYHKKLKIAKAAKAKPSI